MKAKNLILSTFVLLAGLILSACAGLNVDDQPVTGDSGPKISVQEHQTQTFDALWAHLQENYINIDMAGVDWASLHEKYQQRIDAGLTDEQFSNLLHDLEKDLPEGGLTYLSRSERIKSDIADTSTYEGIGIFIGYQEKPAPHIVLLSIIDGSPAEQAGLKAHDSIFKIDGNSILSEEGLNSSEHIRGPSGSSVVLDIQSPRRPERSVEVKRGKIAGTDKIESYILPGTNYGYVLSPPIEYDSLVDDLLNSLQSFSTNQKLEGLILDLRIAGSSSAWPLSEILTIFTDGVVGEFYNRDQIQPLSITGQDVVDSQSIPLIILVGQNTLGFREILAASLQANDRAILIGEKTSGAIERSTSYYLPDGSSIFIQSISFRPSNGEDIGNNGVKPDILVEAGWDQILPNHDPVVDAAIQELDGKK